VKELLIINAEGIAITFLTYLLFSKILPLEKIRNEKPFSFKRIYTSFVPIIFYCLVFYVVILQDRSDRQAGTVYLSINLIFYVLFSMWQFLAKPIFNENSD